MAYKFQRGDATLSGSLVQEGNIEINDNGTFGVQSHSDMLTFVSGSDITVASDLDFDIAKAGGLQLAGVAVTATAAELNLLDNITRGSILFGNSSGNSAELDASTSGQILVGDGNDLASVAVSGDATLASDGALTITDGVVSNAKLENSTLMIGDTNFTLGATGSTLTGLTDLDLAAGARTIFDTVGNNNLTIGASDTTVVIAGDLTVQGTTTTIESANFIVTSSVYFEGTTPDDYEIQFTTANPTADRTITLPDLSGHVPLLAGAASAADVTYAEFSQLDGDTNRVSITIEDADGFLMNDDGVMKHVSASALATYVGSAGARSTGFNMRQLDLDSISDGGQISITPTSDGTGFYGTSADHTASFSIGISGSWNMGDRIVVKSNESGSLYPIEIFADSAYIDGEDSVLLESAYAAISLIWDGANWNIM